MHLVWVLATLRNVPITHAEFFGIYGFSEQSKDNRWVLLKARVFSHELALWRFRHSNFLTCGLGFLLGFIFPYCSQNVLAIIQLESQLVYIFAACLDHTVRLYRYWCLVIMWKLSARGKLGVLYMLWFNVRSTCVLTAQRRLVWNRQRPHAASRRRQSQLQLLCVRVDLEVRRSNGATRYVFKWHLRCGLMANMSTDSALCISTWPTLHSKLLDCLHLCR